jgi:hypothetical protein
MQRYQHHVQALLSKHGLTLIEVDDLDQVDAVEGFIFTLPVTDARTYSLALHEIGHQVHPDGEDYDHYQDGLPLAEVVAWDWAREHSLRWTRAMAQTRTACIETYRLFA